MNTQPFALEPCHLGTTIRRLRVEAKLTQAEVAQRAGITRQKLIDVEQGKRGVAIGTFVAVVDALGLQWELRPRTVRIADFPQLRRITWNLDPDSDLTEPEALAVYERNWRHVDQDGMSADERKLLERLIDRHGKGLFHV